ncbi:adenosylhomocysteinase [Candidatus Roizmanbacteria bacterium]|nr:adenosylhomocysteinase [Candidatus Roizmanbacteria bacterium]
MNYNIANIKLADGGKNRIEWARSRMPVLNLIGGRFKREKPLKGFRLAACLHVTAETANLMLTLQQGGATVVLCASNPLSTQDDVAAALVKHYEIPVFAIHGEDSKTYYRHLEQAIAFQPNITMDDGADLVNELHKLSVVARRGQRPKESQVGQGPATTKYEIKNKNGESWEFLGSSEETTTGVIRLRAMEKDKALKVPVIAVNDSDTKHFFDNRYGTGQSTIDGILRATNILLAGKTFVVCGYGWCGRGLAARARGMGAQVVVTEVDPIKALEAIMDGFMVMPIGKAAKIGDVFVTVTGGKGVISIDAMKTMKDGAILANSGHFDVEIELAKLEKVATKKRKIRENVVEYEIMTNRKSSTVNRKKIYILGEGRLVNLAAAEGHPSEVMDMSFADQALAAEWFVKNRGLLQPKVYRLPKRLDNMVAKLKLKAMGIKIDRLSREQKNYLSSWTEGT